MLDLYLGGDLRFHLSKAPQGRMTPAQVRWARCDADTPGAPDYLTCTNLHGGRIQQVAFYGASLVLALDFLHARGVLHRDIKVHAYAMTKFVPPNRPHTISTHLTQ